MAEELFELSMLGGSIERRYRKARPEVERMPWGSIDPRAYPEADVIEARYAWTRAAFQEHRTGAACTGVLGSLIEARAPIDLIAVGARFPLDELVHVELCARMATELGGGTEATHDPSALFVGASPDLPPLVRAVENTVRVFCVGEALSIPLLRSAWHHASLPLPRAVLGRIVKDEAPHGAFGFIVLDWALPNLTLADRARIGKVADEGIGEIHKLWAELRASPREGACGPVHPLGSLRVDDYLALAARALRAHVIDPLLARGIPVTKTETSFREGDARL